MNNFLSLPVKRADPLPDFPGKIREYIGEHFKDTHPDAFASDIKQLVGLRKSWVEGERGPEIHKSVVDGLLLYYAQISFLLTKFPPNIGITVSYHLPFPAQYAFQSDPTISLPSLTYEQAAVLYNLAAVYAGLAASENRGEGEGIKRALAYLQSAAGALSFLRKNLLSTLTRDLASSYSSTSTSSAGYDMTESFLEAMEHFCLAQAQECFWQRAVLEKYKNGVVAKLAMKVSEYYGLAIKAAKEGDLSSIHNFPQNWVSHLTVKKLHFEAAAQYRMSQDDMEKARYGEEIGRLRLAETLVKQALTEIKQGVGNAVSSDVKSLHGALVANLQRAQRDNDLVYMAPVPPATQLAAIAPAPMVKATVPTQVENSLDWVIKQDGGALFSGLVPYGVHVALSIYDDRKDTLVRQELESKQEELDAIAATTLQSLGLPGALTALERPTGLPPSLLKKAEEVFVEGGLQKVQALLQEVQRCAQADSRILDQSLDTLDQEVTEEEQMLEKFPELEGRMQPSTSANGPLLAQADQFRNTLTQARKSDSGVKDKWEQWAALISILAGGENALLKHIPTSGRNAESTAELPHSARALQVILEDLEDARSDRSRLVAEGKRVAARDDIRSQVVQEGAKLAHGGSGDVKAEWFEDIFDKEMRKYQRLVTEMHEQESKQRKLLSDLKLRNEEFLRDRQDDSRVKHREKKLQEMELAYWKWREVIGNCEEGIKFYNRFADHLRQFHESVQGWVYDRRTQTSKLIAEFREPSLRPEKARSPPRIAPQPQPSFASAPAPPSTAPRFTLPPPGSASWQSAEDFLPPPPSRPQPSSSPAPITPEPSRRVTRSSRQQEQTPITPKPPRKKGGLEV